MHEAYVRPFTASVPLITAAEWCEKRTQQMCFSLCIMAKQANMHKQHMQGVTSQRLAVKTGRRQWIKEAS